MGLVILCAFYFPVETGMTFAWQEKYWSLLSWPERWSLLIEAMTATVLFIGSKNVDVFLSFRAVTVQDIRGKRTGTHTKNAIWLKIYFSSLKITGVFLRATRRKPSAFMRLFLSPAICFGYFDGFKTRSKANKRITPKTWFHTGL